MAFPTLTYTLTNGSTADATQVMTNFNDLLDGISDGSTDINILAATIAGNLAVGGTATLGTVGGVVTHIVNGSMTVTKSTAGATTTLLVSNSDNTSTSSIALVSILTGGASAGDAQLKFSTTANIFSMGIDNSDSDSLVISVSATLGTTNIFKSTTAGVISMGPSLTTTVDGSGIDFTKNSAAANTTIAVSNADNTDPASSARLTATVGGTSAGDPFTLYTITGSTTFATGIDNSDSDKFKISKNTTLGTNDYFSINTSGLVTLGASAGSQSHVVNGFLSITNATVTGAHIQLANTSTEDTTLRFNANGSNWWVIGDDYSDTQSFKIAAADNLTGAFFFKISQTGATTVVGTVNGGFQIPGVVSNLGMTLAAGTFSVTQSDASALSSTSPGYVTLPHTTSGRNITLKATANASFIDDVGASQIIGEEFGVTTGVAWGSDRPFYLYAVNADDTDANLKFAISPNPAAKVSPAGANIGYLSVPAGTPSDSNFFFLTSTNVTATHNAKPCVRIGGIRMRMSALDDWTVQALSSSSGDGIRPDPFESKQFDMVTAQMGSDAGSFLDAGADTVPTWATAANIVYKYKMNLNGTVEISFSTRAAGNATNGTGTTAVTLALPYAHESTTVGATDIIFPAGWYLASAAGVTQGTFIGQVTAGALKRMGLLQSNGSNTVANSFSGATDDLTAYFSMRAFA